MNVIAKRTILYYAAKYPVAKAALFTWLKDLSNSNFTNPNSLKDVFGTASILVNQRVIFNIKGNDFRLITSINFKAQAAYIIWFGTHKEYDNIDANTIKHIIINHK
ncbi:MAG: type II toxin-antitoxin system HigB family toxin [Sphingobacteriaceae bacterium]|nr:MAG: type II toxin-antitoxin system HigB family toxin [Sphingobacteriaceae bacterium]